MLAMEELLCELTDHEKRNAQGLPPGFRFHPTDEELITFYLASKVFNGSFTDVKFVEVDLNRCEPWELPEVAKMGEREWYLFSLRDRKYPTGLRTNRATGAGYWKATGKDKEVYSGSSGALLGMKKTLVFYKGRAPRGEKTKWVMHEYRLDGHFALSRPHSHACTKEEWVICRIFHKSGEKRSPPLLQVQGHLDPSSPTTKGSLPPLLLASPTSFTLELDCQSQSSSQRDFQSQVVIHQQKQNDISHSHTHSHLFPFLHAFQPPFPSHPSSDQLIFKSQQQLPQQNCTALLNLKVKDETIPKVSKTEAAFFPYQQLLDDPNLQHWVDKLNPNPSNSHISNNMPLEMDAGLIAFSSGAAIAEVRDMSSSASMTFNRPGLQQILDASIGIESWPQAQHV